MSNHFAITDAQTPPRVLRLVPSLDDIPPGTPAQLLPAPLDYWPTPPHPTAQLVWLDDALAWHDPRSTEQRSADARTQRDALLAACDWRVTRAIEQGQALDPDWLTYRQALRDISEQAGFPDEIAWPAPPAEGANP